MRFQLIEHSALSLDVKEKFFLTISQSTDKAAANMRLVLKLLETRFTGDKGIFHFIADGSELVGCGGVYVSDFSAKVALLGVRSWLIPAIRGKSVIRDLLLPIQKSWARQRGCNIFALSFNDYNKNLRILFIRNLMNRNKRTADMLFYNNINVVEFPVLIQYVPQWVIYEKDNLDDFDWTTIRDPDYLEV
jgi:hypothetical protein